MTARLGRAAGSRPRRTAGRGSPRPAGRRGFFLQIALSMLFVFAIFVVTYFMFVRGQTRLTQGVLSGEIAYQLAQGGVSAAIAWFSNTAAPIPLRAKLIDLPPDQVNGLKATMPSAAPPVQAMLGKVKGGAELAVELSLEKFDRFRAPDPESGIVQDLHEKRGTLKIVSTAAFEGVFRRVVAYKEVDVVNAIPYVVSKFTLLVSQLTPAAPINLIRWGKVDLSKGQPLPANTHAPIFLRNGPGRDPESSGWVFLGGGPHVLNLALGSNAWGDQFLMLKNYYGVTNVPAGVLPPGTEPWLIERGFFEGIHADNDLFTHFDFTQPAGDPVGEGVAVLRPYGQPAETGLDPDLDVSPTYILGQVYRRFLALRYVDGPRDAGPPLPPCQPSDTLPPAYCPFAGPGDFAAAASAPWTQLPPCYDLPKLQAMKTEYFHDSFAVYAQGDPQLMSNVYADGFNRAFDFLFEPQDLVPAHRLLETYRLRHPLGIPDFLYDQDQNTGYVRIVTADDEKLFDGYLYRLVPADLMIPDRAPYSAPAARFADWLGRHPRQIPGILHFKGADVVIDQPLDLDSGGILAADGSITVAAPVSVKPSGRPLSLVSLTGNITVRTGAPIQAALVALGGSLVRDGDRPLDIRGAVAVQNLDFEAISRTSTHGKIVYDTRLDPTVGEDDRAKRYAVALSPWRTYICPPVE